MNTSCNVNLENHLFLIPPLREEMVKAVGEDIDKVGLLNNLKCFTAQGISVISGEVIYTI